MKRKTASYSLTLLSCLMINPAVYAGTMGDKPGYPDGWSFIAGAGETGFMNVGTYAISANGVEKQLNTRGFQLGFMGDLAVGYGLHVSNPFYLGSEAGVLFLGNRKVSSLNTANNTAVVTQSFIIDSTVTLNQNFSSKVTVSGNPIVPYLDLKPGVLLSENSFLYARIGVDYNELKVRTTANYNALGVVEAVGGPTTSGSLEAGLASTHKKQRAGVRTGLGFEYLLTDNLGMSANYIYAFYSGIKTSSGGPISKLACDTVESCPVNSDGTYTASGHSRISDQQVLLELNYHLA
jgi:opacity protein-like surface antigen